MSALSDLQENLAIVQTAHALALDRLAKAEARADANARANCLYSDALNVIAYHLGGDKVSEWSKAREALSKFEAAIRGDIYAQVSALNAMSQDSGARHRCTVCGCLWRMNQPTDVQPGGSWSLWDAAQKPGACCDNVAMGPQIVPAPLTDPCMRAQEPGWIKIGATCSVGRRSLWLRVTPSKEDANLPEVVELCAGREGDDAYVKIEKSNPLFVELWDLFCTAQFAVET